MASSKLRLRRKTTPKPRIAKEKHPGWQEFQRMMDEVAGSNAMGDVLADVACAGLRDIEVNHPEVWQPIYDTFDDLLREQEGLCSVEKYRAWVRRQEGPRGRSLVERYLHDGRDIRPALFTGLRKMELQGTQQWPPYATFDELLKEQNVCDPADYHRWVAAKQ